MILSAPLFPATAANRFRPRNPLSTRSHQQPSLPGPTTPELPPAAAAVAAAIRSASPGSSVEFTRRFEKPGGGGGGGFVLPSPDFRKLCREQLHLFHMVVRNNVHLSVFVRPAGSYIMDQLELRRVVFYPGTNLSESADYVILVGNFAMPGGLRAAEDALSKQQVEFVTEYGALVLPMVKHPFVVGFLVAELPEVEMEARAIPVNEEQHLPFSPIKGAHGSSQYADKTSEIQPFKEDFGGSCAQFTTDQMSRAVMISRSLATAYVMDQKAMLLQQSSWQNNIRMSHLVEQIHSSLSSIRALSNMLSVQVKRSEISYDAVEGILVQSDHMKDALQQLQDAVYITKANIVRYNEDTLRRMHDSVNGKESLRSLPFEYKTTEPENYNPPAEDSLLPLGSGRKDMEMPMPPLLLAPLQQHDIRPCTVSDVLKDLVEAAVPLAHKQQRFLHLCEDSHPLQVAVEESAMRQALSNLIEGALLRTQVGGRVDICAAPAPAGGGLVVIDDNGPDMHYMTQMHSLTPFGTDLLSGGQVEDNMTWNFVAGLAVAREILEDYGCVVRVRSPRTPDAALGAGGTRIELWLPSANSDSVESGEEA